MQLSNQHGSVAELDETTQLAFYLCHCAKAFLQPTEESSSTSPQVLPALKCLYSALSMVLAPQIEAEIRLFLGNVLLDHTQNFQDALEHIHKAHHLALSSFGAIKFGEKCKIVRSLIDALNRTNSLQLSESIMDSVIKECLQSETIIGWNWFIHFALMSLQLKFEKKMLHQVLTDLDSFLIVIQAALNRFESDPAWKNIILAAKALFLSFLVIVLTGDRKIVSVFMTLPKALQELRDALDEFKTNMTDSATCYSGVLFLGESLLLCSGLSKSSSTDVELCLKNVANLPSSNTLILPGYLEFLNGADFKLLHEFLELLAFRQSSTISFISITEKYKKLQVAMESSVNPVFRDNLSMALDVFKCCLSLQAGSVSSKIDFAKPLSHPEFASKMKSFIMTIMAHACLNRIGSSKVLAFYEHTIKNTRDVDLCNLLQVNRKLLATAPSQPNTDLDVITANLQIPTNSLALQLSKAIELQRSGAAPHHIRAILEVTSIIIQGNENIDPSLCCIFHLLRGELNLQVDFELSRSDLQTAYHIASNQLLNQNLAGVAAGNLAKSFELTGDDELKSQWAQLKIK